jgi:hypothetical protein
MELEKLVQLESYFQYELLELDRKRDEILKNLGLVNQLIEKSTTKANIPPVWDINLLEVLRNFI